MLRSSALTDASLCQATAQQAPVWLRARCLEAREEFQGLWAVNLSPESSVHSVIYCSHISLVWPAFTLTETFFFFQPAFIKSQQSIPSILPRDAPCTRSVSGRGAVLLGQAPDSSWSRRCPRQQPGSFTLSPVTFLPWWLCASSTRLPLCLLLGCCPGPGSRPAAAGV